MIQSLFIQGTAEAIYMQTQVLSPVKHVSLETSINRDDDKRKVINGMSFNPAENALYLSFNLIRTNGKSLYGGGVQTISLDNLNIKSHLCYTCNEGIVLGMCFVRFTGSLLIAKGDRLVTRSRGVNVNDQEEREWMKEDHEKLSLRGSVHFAELPNAQVVFGARRSKRLQLLRVTKDHCIEMGAIIELSTRYLDFDASFVAGDTLVALIHAAKNWSFVFLYKVVANSTLEEISRISLTQVRRILWYNDKLIAACRKGQSALELFFSNGALVRRGEHFRKTRVRVWCVAKDYIAIIEKQTESEELLSIERVLM